MTRTKLLKKTALVGPIIGAMVAGAVLIGCSSGAPAPQDNDRAAAQQAVTEQREEGSSGEHDRNGAQGREAGGEHRSRVESGGESGQHSEARERGGESGGESGQHNEARERGGESGGEASSANALARNATFDEVRGGARLVLKFDDASNSFLGKV
ncbi:MAG: hypothetical protein F4X58_11890 [Chloroflexi bacterium]|nr:hypothetical protein [Chloroflexota bacterium]